MLRTGREDLDPLLTPNDRGSESFEIFRTRSSNCRIRTSFDDPTARSCGAPQCPERPAGCCPPLLWRWPSLTAQQLDFLQVLTNHLVENGKVNRAALFDSPYNELAPSGPDVLFGGNGVVKLFGILRSIEERARIS